MKIKELTLTIDGPLWSIYEIEIENIDVKGQYKEKNGKGIVTVKNFDLSADNTLDAFVSIGAPNGTDYTVSLEGKVEDNNQERDISYSEDFEVKKNGTLRINISQKINDIIK